MKILLSVLCLAAGLLPAQTGRLSLASVRNWSTWDAQLKSLSVNTEIRGMIARTSWEMTFADRNSTAGAGDSLELSLDFNLPENSVADSLVLWVGTEPVPGVILPSWQAWQVYNSIVNRRRDPALLTTGYGRDKYQLKIFPFFRRQERKVKIWFYTPLRYLKDEITLEYPLQMTAWSRPASESFALTIHAPDVQPAYLDVERRPGGFFSKSSDGRGTRLAWEIPGTILSVPLKVSITDPARLRSGLLVDFGRDRDGEAYFAAFLNPNRLLDREDERHHKILLLWNNTTEYYYNSSPVPHYQPHPLIDEDKRQILEFVGRTLDQDDSFNCVLTADKIKQFRSGLVPMTAAARAGFAAFLDTAAGPRAADKAPSWANLLRAARAAAAEESLEVVIVDRVCGRAWYPIYSGFDSAAAIMEAAVPAGWTVYALAEYANFYLYQDLARLRGGDIIQSYWGSDLAAELTRLLPRLSTRIYPADINFSVPGGFSYDRLGPESYAFFLDAPLVYYGRLYSGNRLRVEFNGVVEGGEYQESGTFSAENAAAGPGIAKLWAARKVEAMIDEFDYSNAARREVTDLAAGYGIVSSYTSLLSLEPGMNLDSLLALVNNSPNNGQIFFMENVVQVRASFSGDAVMMATAPAFASGEACPLPGPRPAETVKTDTAKSVLVTPNPFNPSTTIRIRNPLRNASLSIYDLAGRLVWSQRHVREGAVTWNAPGLPSGIYVLMVKTPQFKTSRTLMLNR